MGKAIAIFNQKGGVGKTTTNINLAACLANRGKKVLMVDIDPQGNTTSGIGIRKRTLKTTLYDCLIDETFDVRKAILPTNTENLFIIPASVDLAGAEVELAQLEARERRLKRVIDAVRKDYDFILVDCPPSLGVLTINSLTAVDSVLIPIQCEFYALEGVSQLISTIEMVRKTRYDAIFMDHMMPEMDGIEAARYIRKMEGKEKQYYEKWLSEQGLSSENRVMYTFSMVSPWTAMGEQDVRKLFIYGCIF